MRMIEKVWFQGHPAKWWLVPLLFPLTLIFWLLSTLRRLSFKCGLSESIRLNVPVVVVGNIGVGGNGKTPVVIYLLELCRSLGFNPGVISRGYGGDAPYYPYLLTKDSSANQAGDEPMLIFNRCQVPVAVGSNRIDTSELLIKQGCDIIISDDGLQHYRLQRDLELIIVDGKRRFGNGLLLPAGPLREGKWRLSTSDLVIYNGKKSSNNQQTTAIDNESKLLMSLVPSQVINLQTKKSISITDFVNTYPQVNAVAGIGDPQRFFDTLLSQNLNLATKQSFVDHHSYCLDDFIDFNDSIPLLMTEKDAVKCQSFCQKHWWYLPVDASFNKHAKQLITDNIKKLSL